MMWVHSPPTNVHSFKGVGDGVSANGSQACTMTRVVGHNLTLQWTPRTCDKNKIL